METSRRFSDTYVKNFTDALERSKRKNIILTGGCALNCVANYWYLDKLPKGVKLYVEPIANDVELVWDFQNICIIPKLVL